MLQSTTNTNMAIVLESRPPLFKPEQVLSVWNGSRYVSARIMDIPKGHAPEKRLSTYAYWLEFLEYQPGEPMQICITEADLVNHVRSS